MVKLKDLLIQNWRQNPVLAVLQGNSASGYRDLFGDKNIQLIAVIACSLPIFFSHSTVVSLNQLLPVKFVGCVHRGEHAGSNLWIFQMARVLF